jgi:hypothetical protein
MRISQDEQVDGESIWINPQVLNLDDRIGAAGDDFVHR